MFDDLRFTNNLNIYLRIEFPFFSFFNSFKWLSSISTLFLDVNKYDETLN